MLQEPDAQAIFLSGCPLINPRTLWGCQPVVAHEGLERGSRGLTRSAIAWAALLFSRAGDGPRPTSVASVNRAWPPGFQPYIEASIRAGDRRVVPSAGPLVKWSCESCSPTIQRKATEAKASAAQASRSRVTQAFNA